MNIGIGQTRPELAGLFSDAVKRAIDAGEVGLQVAVYRGSELVVDIWAGIADVTTGRLVQADTLSRHSR